MTILPRINSSAPDGFNWDYMAIMEGWSSRMFSTQDAAADSYGTIVTPAPQIDVDIESGVITFLFSSDALGSPDTLDGAKVYVSTWDWNGPDAEYRFLRPPGGQWGFGGGDWSVDPLIIDDTEIIVLGQEERLSQPDPAGDNYGPYAAGKIAPYTLPTDADFGDQTDLRSVDVTRADGGLLVSMEMGEIERAASATNGFDHVLIHIFFDHIDDQGSEILPYLNSQAPQGFAWDFLAVVDGWSSTLYSANGAGADAYGTTSPVGPSIEVDHANGVLKLLIEPQTMDLPESLDNLKLYITTWDINDDLAGFRALTPEGGPREFGGGDGEVDPLIIDDVLLGMPQVFDSQIPPTPQVEVTFEVTVPPGTPDTDSLYLTGPFNQYNPSDAQYQFSYEGSGLYRLTLSLDEGQYLAYRITRGSFNNAEKINPDDRFADREIVIPTGEESLVIAIEVQGWWDD